MNWAQVRWIQWKHSEKTKLPSLRFLGISHPQSKRNFLSLYPLYILPGQVFRIYQLIWTLVGPIWPSTKFRSFQPLWYWWSFQVMLSPMIPQILLNLVTSIVSLRHVGNHFERRFYNLGYSHLLLAHWVLSASVLRISPASLIPPSYEAQIEIEILGSDWNKEYVNTQIHSIPADVYIWCL